MIDLVRKLLFLANPGVAPIAFETALLRRVLPDPLIPPGGLEAHHVSETPEKVVTHCLTYLLRSSDIAYPTMEDIATYLPHFVRCKTAVVVVRDPICRLAEIFLQWAPRGHDFNESVKSGEIFKRLPADTFPQKDLLVGGTKFPDTQKHVVFYDEEDPNRSFLEVLSHLGIPALPGEALPEEAVTKPRKIAKLRASLSMEARLLVNARYAKDYKAWGRYSVDG